MVMEQLETERKPVVVVVDDDVTHGRLFELVSDQLGIEVRICRSCNEAMEVLSVINADLVLMDIRMPEVDGLACTSKIRLSKNADQLPVVAVTAMVQDGTKQRCLALGMNDYLAKPFSIEELQGIFSAWIKKAAHESK